jgi:hypothetical protein
MPIHGGGTCQRPVRRDGVEGVKLSVDGINSDENLLANVSRFSPAGSNVVADFAKGSDAAHPITRGTLNNPDCWLASGALLSASLLSSDATTTSARSAE